MTKVLKSMRNVKINGEWLDEVAKEMDGLKVIAIQIRGGAWYSMNQVEARS